CARFSSSAWSSSYFDFW
nr:immunoglobulin heavy chain junction region [Macaca mulatta]